MSPGDADERQARGLTVRSISGEIAYLVDSTVAITKAERTALLIRLEAAFTMRLDATRAELEAYREAAGFRDPEDFATKDRMRTREHNLLTAENRSLSAELAAERERCAMACEADEAESLRVPGVNRWDDSPATARRCAAAIRALATAPAPSAPKAEGGDRG